MVRYLKYKFVCENKLIFFQNIPVIQDLQSLWLHTNVWFYRVISQK